MKRWMTDRGRCRSGALCFLVCSLPLVLSPAFAQAAQSAKYQAPAPIERRPPPAPYNAAPAQAAPGNTGSYAIVRQQPTNPSINPASHVSRGEHLAQWMSLHSSLTPEQQQRALAEEPGFTHLPEGTQQRLRERLSQLDAMPPAQRPKAA